MKDENISYKGYKGSIEVSIEDSCLYGRVLFIDDIVTYEGDTIDEIRSAFQESVDCYLNHCAEVGKAPNKSYSGTFNVRVGEERHKKIAKRAHVDGIGINELVNKAVDCFLDGTDKNSFHLYFHDGEKNIHRIMSTSKAPEGWTEMGNAIH